MDKKNIVILGAGFGGITAALKLAKNIGDLKDDYEIILVDRHHHQLYTPALYEIASITVEETADEPLKSSILIPIADVIRGKPITFLCDEAIGLKKEEKKVILQKLGELSYEFLILAMGSETNYFDIPGLQENSFPLKTFDDGSRLRKRVEDLAKTKKALKIIIGGAGATGVELAAEFVNFICAIKRDAGIQDCDVSYLLVEASPEILPGFEPVVVKKVKKRLEKLGIEIKTNSAIASADKNEIIFKDGAKEYFDILIWTGGVKGPAVLKNFRLQLSPKGSANIDEYLRVQGTDGRIFAIGDNSSFVNPKTGKPLTWNVPVAEAEGRVVAKNILLAIRGRNPKKFIPLKKYPFILAVGKKYAVADLIFIHIGGFFGWALKQLVELRYLLFILPIKKALNTWLKGLKYFSSND